MMFLPDHIIEEFDLMPDERQFFDELWKQTIDFPDAITLHRSSKYAPFNVYLGNWGYIGKIRLYRDPDKYAVMRNGRKRAFRICDTEDEAERLVTEGKGDFTEIRKSNDERFMQIQYGKYHPCSLDEDSDKFRQNLLDSFENIEIIEGVDLDTYISKIPYWINFCNEVLIPIHYQHKL